MPTLRINGRETEVADGVTVLQAARKMNVDVPTLCHLEGYPAFTSCMVCTVKDRASGRDLPSCSTPVADGMDIETDGEAVKAARKDTLDLLLSEHVGNCEGPCHRACPADVNIPLIISMVEQGRLDQAAEHLNLRLTFPSMVERICVAPCERTCRRDEYDSAVSIRQLLRYVADDDLARGSPSLPRPAPATGRHIAVVGTGPTGMAAAFHLLLMGHACTLFDERGVAGGNVRSHVPPSVLPPEILDAEMEKVWNLGAHARFGVHIGRDESMQTLRSDFDAVVLAAGKLKPETPATFDLRGGRYGLEVRPGTMQTSADDVFTGGDAVRPYQSVAWSVADGRLIADSVHRFLSGASTRMPQRRFNSRVGRLQEDELERFVEGYDRRDRVSPAGGDMTGFDSDEALREAGRCLHCECLKADTCTLRLYADAYGAAQDGYLHRIRSTYRRVLQHADVIFEPGKCIKCGLCVRIARQHGETTGLTFVDRGFDVRVDVPLDGSLADGLCTVARECVDACPTAALSFKSDSLRKISSPP